MKPFKFPARDALIEFDEEHPFHGIQVRVKLDVPYRFFIELRQLASEADKEAEANEKWAEEVLMEWNYSEDGEKIIPVSEWQKAPASLLSEMVVRWLVEAQNISAPLGVPSPPAG